MTPTLGLASPLGAVKGVGPAGARLLSSAGLDTVLDLLLNLPHRYEDRSNPRAIGSLGVPGEVVTVGGRLLHLRERRARARRLRLVEAVVDDGTGAIPVVWFNQPYLAGTLSAGGRVWLHGSLRPARSGLGLQLVGPEWEFEDEDTDPIHLGRIVPMYRRVGSWSGRRVRSLVARALGALGEVDDPLRSWLPEELDLPPLGEALASLHFPPAPVVASDLDATLDALARRTTPAHRRLAFEELLALGVVLERERATRRSRRALACTVDDAVRERARAVLPFHLTAAQKRVLAEIVADLRGEVPMARLLQGDVGSGKTIVATLAALVVLESGAQVALLAPTELLVQQHLATLARLLAPTAYRPAVLSGSLPGREKTDVRGAIEAGAARLVVGTHALLQDVTTFAHLGLVVIDEQHRFGVAQRQALLAKGHAPHLLVMTATPIPRSLALTVYGDLDVSVLDELPPGRSPIRTVLRDDSARPRLAEFLRREVDDGARVYWVFPLIEESQKVSRRAVETHARAVKAALAGVGVAVVHGRTPAVEREAVMAAFAAGSIRVLCATTVIEVGVDVPEASVMVIENAETFGLAQLHQLRGRVGRGTRPSWCVLLVGEGCSAEARTRLEYFASTTDGFRIAEEDFRSRGPGELTGARQWGRPEFRVASLVIHRRELEAARQVAATAATGGTLASLESALSGRDLLGKSVPVG
jgi:ATP-dependent DNA helicase RecG